MVVANIETRQRARQGRRQGGLIARSEPAHSDAWLRAGRLWRSEGGSLYICNGKSLVCISVHSAAFRGWVGKVAVRKIREIAGVWEGEQAFRDRYTGELTDWQPVTLQVSENRIIKYFDGRLPAGTLVYGHVENYYRVRLQ